MTSAIRISIIIPTFNRADLLDQAILSALAQTHPDCDLLVVDDGSSDHTSAVTRKYGPRVRYLSQRNRGKAAALNLGIAASVGDVILVLDDDDLLPRWAAARHADALMNNSVADFSYGRYLRFASKTWPTLSDLGDEELIPYCDPRRLVIKLMERCFISNPTWAVRKEAQLRAGPYNEQLHRSQDFEMILRLARRNDGTFINDVVHLQRTHESVRGPAFDQTYSAHTTDMWIKYDTIILKVLDKEWDLADFRPFHDSSNARHPERLALLQKGVILFQRKHYDGAKYALSEYLSRLPGPGPTNSELKIAAGLLGCRYGITDVLFDRPLNDSTAKWLRAGNWPLLLRMAFATQIRWRLRESVATKQFQQARKLIEFSRKAFGPVATLAVLGSRYNGGAELWRISENSNVDLQELIRFSPT